MYSKSLYYNICFVRKEKRRCREPKLVLGGLHLAMPTSPNIFLNIRNGVHSYLVNITPKVMDYRFWQNYTPKNRICQEKKKNHSLLGYGIVGYHYSYTPLREAVGLSDYPDQLNCTVSIIGYIINHKM